MRETFEFLKQRTKVNFVATMNGDRPSNRPFGDPVLFNDKIYIITNKEKEVSKQITVNNKVCVVAHDVENDNWIRINCELIDDSSNVAAKQAMMNEFDWMEEAGYTLDNPNFQVLYMKNVNANIYDIDGNILSSHKF